MAYGVSVPTMNTTMPHILRLPVEIILLVVMLVDNQQDLRHLSLAHRLFTAPAQSSIFHDLCISASSKSSKFAHVKTRFSKNPRLAANVISLTLRGSARPRFGVLSCRPLQVILHLFPRLKSLIVHSVKWTPDTPILKPQPSYCAVNLKHVSFYNIDCVSPTCTPLYVLDSSTTWCSIHIGHIQSIPATTISAWNPIHPCYTITSLRLDVHTISWSELNLPIFEGVKYLCLDCINSLSLRHIRIVNSILQQSCATLEFAALYFSVIPIGEQYVFSIHVH